MMCCFRRKLVLNTELVLSDQHKYVPLFLRSNMAVSDDYFNVSNCAKSQSLNKYGVCYHGKYIEDVESDGLAGRLMIDG
jgi:hypothetical protein